MKTTVLEVLVCPGCAGRLAIEESECNAPYAGAPEEIASGRVRCESCRAAYPVADYVPDFRTGPSSSQAATIGHYSALWAHSLPGDLQSPPRLPGEGFRPHVAAVAEAVDFGLRDDQWVLDAGCGDGDDLLWLGARNPAVSIAALDLSEGVHVARRRSALLANVHVLRASVLQPPVAPRSFDLVYSYGVLHHTPEPERGFRALASAVKPGGMLVTYLYTDLREEPLLRLALTPVTALREVTRRLSPTSLRSLARALSPVVYWVFGRPASALRRLGYPAAARRLPFHWVAERQGAYGDLFDRLGAEYEWRYNPAQLRAWHAAAGLSVEVQKLPDRRGWLSVGRRPTVS